MSTATPFSFILLKPSPETITEGAVSKRHFEAAKSLFTALAGLLNASHEAKISFELVAKQGNVGSSRVDLQACKLEYSIVSPK